MPITAIDKKNAGQKNRGYLYERTKTNDLEKSFADKWEEDNKNYAILQKLFYEPGGLGFGFTSSVHDVSASERYVAATVVQWLGTNCGFAFLQAALRRCGYYVATLPDIDPRLPKPEKPPENALSASFAKRKIVS